MSEDGKKLFVKKGTGTVPKVKHRNNVCHLNSRDMPINLNNLVSSVHSLIPPSTENEK